MIDKSQTQTLIGAEVRTNDGTKVGRIGQVYLDDYYGEPEWVTVYTGSSGGESFVPVGEALVGEGNIVSVPYSRAQIKGAPSASDSDHLSEAEERKLYDYYEIGYATEASVPSGGRHSEPGSAEAGHARLRRYGQVTESAPADGPDEDRTSR